MSLAELSKTEISRFVAEALADEDECSCNPDVSYSVNENELAIVIAHNADCPAYHGDTLEVSIKKRGGGVQA